MGEKVKNSSKYMEINKKWGLYNYQSRIDEGISGKGM
jgi:hypothetical protein